MIKDYIDNWQKNNAHFDGIYSGFMTGSKQIELFMDFLDVFYEKNTMLLVDPVMGDDGRTYGIYSAAHFGWHEGSFQEGRCHHTKSDRGMPFGRL